MTIRLLLISLSLTALGIVLSGCEVETEPNAPLSYPPANHVVINEVYVLPTTNPNAHCWLELYNPTQQTVDLARRWSISFRTTRNYVARLVFYDSSLVPITTTNIQFQYRVDSLASYQVPIIGADSLRVRIARTDTVLGYFPNTVVARFEVRTNEFFTLVSDLDRLRVYNTIGPGNGPSPESSPILPLNGVQFYEIAAFRRSVGNLRLDIPDTLYGYSYPFYLQKSDQIVLKDSVGKVVDVLRYGGYTYPGPGNDPYPGNRSIGIIPDFESAFRYAGAYDTGNSANDFNITRPGLRPIPHWLSQEYKK